jgi:hypothetical protein
MVHRQTDIDVFAGGRSAELMDGTHVNRQNSVCLFQGKMCGLDYSSTIFKL